ncbi:MAG: hypothetical protein KF708_03085 [Pirellulales bacterium]|nr:hypothetical protein [Pirellulales bacterium]
MFSHRRGTWWKGWFTVVFLLLFAPAGQVLARADDLAIQATEYVGEQEIYQTSPSFLDGLQDFPRIWHVDPYGTVRLRGRVDTDFLWTSQSAANEATFGDLGDTVGLRRARIGAEGAWGTSGRYIAEIDLAPGVVVPRDIFAGFGERQAFGEGRVGHFREPFSLEGATSANFFAFMERSPINLLDPARNWGLGLFRTDVGESATLALGAFHAGTDAGDFEGGDGSTVGFTGRLTGAFFRDDACARYLLVGVSLSERLPEQGVIVINQQPRNPLLELGDSSSPPFVPVIEIPASFQQLMNVQALWAEGPYWIQSEWYGSLIAQTGAADVFFHGSYVACGWFVTGEHRDYDGANAVPGAIRVARPVLRGPASREKSRGGGAWELAARFGYLDFFDPDTPRGPNGQLLGIGLPTATFGVNWYLTDRMRLLFNYTYQAPDEPNTGSSASSIYGMRLNVHW